MYQCTVTHPITLKGVGLHSGKNIKMRLFPAPCDTGIIFKRIDIASKNNQNIVPFKYNLVEKSALCTKVVNKHGIAVSTIEHLCSALGALGVDNVLIKLDQEEVPILDGCALQIAKAILATGLQKQQALRKYLYVLKPITINTDDWSVSLKPANTSQFNVEIDFDNQVVSSQKYEFNLNYQDYLTEIAPARTFCLLKEIEYLRSLGLIQGGNLNNAIVIDEDKVLNEDGLRFEDEFVRHKVLDSIGDLLACGYMIKGEFSGCKSGHYANNMLLRELMKDSSAYMISDSREGKINNQFDDDLPLNGHDVVVV